MNAVDGPSTPRIAVLGAGSLGRAIVARLLAAGCPATSLHVTTRTAEQAARVARNCPVTVGHDNVRAAEGADAVILTVRPEHAAGVLAGVRPVLADDAALVSFVAGWPLHRLSSPATARRVAAFRVATNAVSVERGGLVAVTAAPSVPAETRIRVHRILALLGEVVEIPEAQQDVAASTLGSGAAFLALCGTGIAGAAASAGLIEGTAGAFVADALQSAAVLLRRAAADDDAWHRLATPGGITEAGLATLVAARVPGALAEAVQAAVRRAGEMNVTDETVRCG